MGQHIRLPTLADICTEDALVALEVIWSGLASHEEQLRLISNAYGTESPQYQAVIIGLTTDGAALIEIEQGTQAALDYVTPNVEQECARVE